MFFGSQRMMETGRAGLEDLNQSDEIYSQFWQVLLSVSCAQAPGYQCKPQGLRKNHSCMTSLINLERLGVFLYEEVLGCHIV